MGVPRLVKGTVGYFSTSELKLTVKIFSNMDPDPTDTHSY